MGKFASGKESYAISDRSGFRYPYRLMKKEWNGLLVGPDEYEPKQPQIETLRFVGDAIALADARPDRTEPLLVLVGVPGVFQIDSIGSANNTTNMQPLPVPDETVTQGQIGTVTVTIS